MWLYLEAPIVCVIDCSGINLRSSNQYTDTPTRARTDVPIAFSNLITSILFLCKALFSSTSTKFL